LKTNKERISHFPHYIFVRHKRGRDELRELPDFGSVREKVKGRREKAEVGKCPISNVE
jgi:hypothetical protein